MLRLILATVLPSVLPPSCLYPGDTSARPINHGIPFSIVTRPVFSAGTAHDVLRDIRNRQLSPAPLPHIVGPNVSNQSHPEDDVPRSRISGVSLQTETNRQKHKSVLTSRLGPFTPSRP